MTSHLNQPMFLNTGRFLQLFGMIVILTSYSYYKLINSSIEYNVYNVIYYSMIKYTNEYKEILWLT